MCTNNLRSANDGIKWRWKATAALNWTMNISLWKTGRRHAAEIYITDTDKTNRLTQMCMRTIDLNLIRLEGDTVSFRNCVLHKLQSSSVMSGWLSAIICSSLLSCSISGPDFFTSNRSNGSSDAGAKIREINPPQRGSAGSSPTHILSCITYYLPTFLWLILSLSHTHTHFLKHRKWGGG